MSVRDSSAPAPGRKRRFVLAAASMMLLGSALWLAFNQAGRFLEAAQQDPMPADLIVSTGGDWGGRTKKAADLYRRGYAKRILLLGADALPPVSGQPVLGTRRKLLRELGVPHEAILMEPAQNSREEVAGTLRLMQVNGWKRALVVSDPPHMRRLAWLWGREFDGGQRQYILVAANMENWEAASWWRNPWSAEFVRTEYLKLAYALLVR